MPASSPVCIVVGIGPGLGVALARRFVQGGCHVAAVGRRATKVAELVAALRDEGGDVTGFSGDAGDPASLSKVFDRIRAESGQPEILIYNAALIEPARFVTSSAAAEVRYAPNVGWRARGVPADFDYVVDAFKTNVAGALHASQEALRTMRQLGRGTILLTGGILAFDPWLEWGVTALGKAALRSLGLSLAKELTEEGIHVVTIAIHGTMQAGTPYDPNLVADAYWRLYQQPRQEWQPEFHFKAGDRSSQ
ncbi:MAG: SDR family NAD(P)-dependent oxidoreductase [Proteobacteria bacterium]|nr:SDR family NAD(P)-dependent oxidoreductase [Pseudomonadota bacterium]